MSSLCTSHPIPALVLSLGYKYLPLEGFYCVVTSFSFAGLKAAPKSNQTVQRQQCNLVVSLGNYLTKPICSLSHKLPIKLIVQHPPNPAPFPSSSFQYPSNSYSGSSGKCLHFSLPNPTILLIDVNQKNNSTEPSGLLSPPSSIPALLTARMSQLNRGLRTYSCNSSAVAVMRPNPPQLSAVLF